MNVAGVSSEVTLLQIPSVLFSEDYASLGTFFILFVQLVPAFAADDPATGKPGSDAWSGLKHGWRAFCFS
jgi:hypothetical protein